MVPNSAFSRPVARKNRVSAYIKHMNDRELIISRTVRTRKVFNLRYTCVSNRYAWPKYAGVEEKGGVLCIYLNVCITNCKFEFNVIKC